MRRFGLLLFGGLGLGGLIIGVILGEVLLTRGSGRYVGPVLGIIGLLLAWMLWITPRPTEPLPPPELPPVPPQEHTKPQAQRRKVNVQSTATAREQRGGRSKRR